MANIIIALISAIGSILGAAIGAVIGIVANTKLVTYRIEQLESKVDKHNNLIERTYNIEARLDVDEEKLEVANHRIKDLENQQLYSDNKFVKEM